MIYCSSNSDQDGAVYVLGIGVRDPAAWKDKLPVPEYIRPLASWLGRETFLDRLRRRIGL